MAAHHPVPLWSQMYSNVADVALITLFTIWHALDITESTRAVRAILDKEQNKEVLRFEEVHSGAGDDGDDGSLDEDCSVDSSASRYLTISTVAPPAYSAHPHSIQSRAHQSKQSRSIRHWGELLVIDRTSGGKASSHTSDENFLSDLRYLTSRNEVGGLYGR